MALLTRAELSKFQNFIASGNYESAIKLADKFGLEKDDVYKPQWSASDFGTEAIRNVLSRVEDEMWVVKECKERVCPGFEAMNSLLLCGLRLTEPYVYTGSGTGAQEGVRGKDKAWWFRYKRLRLLQYKDRLDTFVGINNGRYSQNNYETFRSVPLQKVALGFAERGKTGPLSLLFKRHVYSLAPYILQLLDAIPESVSPQNYGQLLPAASPPKPLLPRKIEDWVEKAEILKAMKTSRSGLFQAGYELDLEDSTENMVKVSKGLVWPKKEEIVDWYKKRAKGIDKSCGLLENSLTLLDAGVGKGLTELETFFEDVSDLYGVVFSIDSNLNEVDLRLSDWECLSKYEKFKLILDGAKEETAVERLTDQALPFMIRNQTFSAPVVNEVTKNVSGETEYRNNGSQSFLVRWLKDTAKENKLLLCSEILAACYREPRATGLFASDDELVEVVLDCIYACSLTDEWTLMSSMLTKLPQRELKGKESSTIVDDVQGPRGLRTGFFKAIRGAVVSKSSDGQLAMTPLTANVDDMQPMFPGGNDVSSSTLSETLEERLRQAEGHVEAGQLLLQYQVPKPICYFLTCREDVSGTKKLVRILLLKFSNREAAKSDNGWATLWRNLRILQEKAFPFLDKEYLLSELCQGILKAGKFSLAKNYLKGTGTTILRTEKAEKLVLNAAREYFYSAPDLESSSIGKAKQCLNLLPASEALTMELNLIDAITEHLPALGVTLLPVQFRQLKDSMEVIKMAISSHPGAYLNIPEIMELARLFRLSSPDDILAIEAAIAREADASGDFALAQDMCLGLVKKGYGPIWDLCAALGRRSDFEQLDLETRKKLLGFALGHCDEDFLGELLGAWKEYDLLSSCNNIGGMVGKPVVSLVEHERAVASLSERLDSQRNASSSNENGEEPSWWQGGRNALSCVIAKNTEVNEQSWKLFAQEKKKALWFVCLHLPWLLEVVSGKSQMNEEGGVEVGWCNHHLPKECHSLSAQAVALILRALSTNDIGANDDLILRLAQEAMTRPVSNEGDTVGCGYLLNLGNALLGAELLENELEKRDNYQEAQQALELALSFSTLQELVLDLRSSKLRRDILIRILRERKFSMPGSGSQDAPNNSFWSDFNIRAVEKLRVSEESRRLQKLLPEVDVGRFISGDDEYIQEQIFCHVDSMKMQQENGLSKMLTLAEQYDVEQWQVYKRYFLALVGADWTSEEEIIREISGFWARLLVNPQRLPDTIEVYECVVTPALGGLRKEGPLRSSGKEHVSEFKRTLVRALVSLSSGTAPPNGEPISSDLLEPNSSEMLNRLRHLVWQKLCSFAEDLQAPLHCRIFILELLEATKNGKVPRMDFWHSCQLEDYNLVVSWGQWDAEVGNLESLKQLEGSGGKEKPNVGSAVNVLLALQSTQIISKHWPGWEVTYAELSSPEAATSFFNTLLEVTSSIGQTRALKALLELWESALGFEHLQGDRRNDARTKEDEEYSGGENWGEEGWDEFSDNSWIVHTLHSCWKAILLKLTELGGLREALGVLDTALLHPTSVLVTEDEAKELVAAIGLSNPSAALQLSLLLPYNSSQVQGLQLLEEKLQHMYEKSSDVEGNRQLVLQQSDVVSQDLMALVLSSGLLPSTADDPSLQMVFSALCGFLGHLVLQVQELQLSKNPSLSECLVSIEKVPLCAVAFPFFVAELTKAKHYGQAGALVLQFMRVHPALATWNAVYMALQRFLSTQVDGASVEACARRGKDFLQNQGNTSQLSHLRNTVHSLTCRLEDVLKSALKILSKDIN